MLFHVELAVEVFVRATNEKEAKDEARRKLLNNLKDPDGINADLLRVTNIYAPLSPNWRLRR